MSLKDQSTSRDAGDAARARAILDLIVDELPFGLSITTPEGDPIYANGAATRHGLDRPTPPSRSDGLSIDVGTSRHAIEGRDYLVRLSRDVTEQRSLEDTLFRKAYFDELTGLPNRSLFEQSVRDLIDHGKGEPFALAFLDLDNFKQINDHHGHGAGDELLVKLSRRMAAHMRESDLLARVGGDEFLLALTPIDDVAALRLRLEVLLQRVRDPILIAGQEVYVSASVGFSLYPDHGRDQKTLCVNADLAMYRMKGSGKAGVTMFDAAVGQSAAARTILEQRLRLAIRDRRFCCVYQPKIDFRSAELTGLEVLLRWRDESGAIQLPGEIIALATDLGLMDEITHTILGQTLDAMARIDETFGPTTTISINIAARQATQIAFMASVADVIAASGLAHRFMLELTEDAFLNKDAFQNTILPLLQEHGIKVSIDDFGTGYSSLSALADLTADEIKVDRSFITDIHRRPRSQVILKAVESLGRALDMSVIVEGVETAEELAYLEAATQIRFAQGYFFAKPMLLDDLVAGTTLTDRHVVPSRAGRAPRQPSRRSR